MFKKKLKPTLAYVKRKLIQARGNFLINVGTLAVMLHTKDCHDYNEYVDYLEKTITIDQNLSENINSLFLE